jgi:hypothetical protein
MPIRKKPVMPTFPTKRSLTMMTQRVPVTLTMMSDNVELPFLLD